MEDELKQKLLDIIDTLLRVKLSAAKGNLQNHNLGSVGLELTFIEIDLKRMRELLNE